MDDVVLLLEGLQEYRGLISCFSGAVTMHKVKLMKLILRLDTGFLLCHVNKC